jgi:LysM repeat protein
LGLEDDEQSRLAFASESHACYRTGKAKPVSIAHQRQYCLGRAHTTCPIFLNAGLKSPKTAAAALPRRPKVNPRPQAAPVVTLVEQEPHPIWDEMTETKPRNPARFAHLWELAGVAIFIIILLGGWWLFNNRDLFFTNNTPVQASIVGTVKPSPTVTNTEIFIPNVAHVLGLTVTPFPTKAVTASITPLMTVTASRTVTETSTLTKLSPSRTATPTSAACSQPEGWTTYTIVSGDTLFYLANYFRITVDELIRVNCLDSTTIYPGQEIFLPGIPPALTATRSTTPTSTQVRVSASRTPTPTFRPTQTPTQVFTATSIPPTNTPVPTYTFTQIPTETPPPTPTASARPTFASPTNTPSSEE